MLAPSRLRGSLSCAEEFVLEPHRRTQIPVAFKEIVVPVRLYVMDTHAIDYQGGYYQFTYPRTRRQFAGVSLGCFQNEVHWVPAGHVVVTATVDHDRSAREEIELPRAWTAQPIECCLTVK
jgi:hypothetical protein